MVDIAAVTRRFLELVAGAGEQSFPALEPLRGRAGLVVRSTAVNGARVDVVAADDADEWRIVFGLTQDAAVDWLEVYRRPLRYDGVPGGRGVLVNGPSSVGKSTVLAELQSRSDLPWVVFDEPHFGAVQPEHLIWRDGREVLHRGFLDGIAALARAGNHVAVAAGGHPQAWFTAAFAGVPLLCVGLHCPIEELGRREATRHDVPGGLAASSLGVHDGWSYDLEFDTAGTTLDEIVDAVARAVSA